MTQQELANKLESLTTEITVDNFSSYYDQFEEVLISYKLSKGKGMFAYELLWKLWIQYNDDDYINEILGDMMSRMHGYCSPGRDIDFEDLKDFSKFDMESGKFIE